MNFKYLVGRSLSDISGWVLSIKSLPLMSAVPFDYSLPYDVMRYAGTKDFRVIIDVGANIGQTYRYLRPFFPNTQIHCFEPIPDTYKILQETVGKDPHAQAHQAALSNSSGTIGMKACDYSEMSTVVTENSEANCQVPCLRLDDFARQQGIDRIDLLKIDVEGHELQVLEGASGLLRENRIRAIYTEIGISLKDREHTPFTKVHEMLDPLGLSFVGIYGAYRTRQKRYHLEFANALYWNPAFDASPERKRNAT